MVRGHKINCKIPEGQKATIFKGLIQNEHESCLNLILPSSSFHSKIRHYQANDILQTRLVSCSFFTLAMSTNVTSPMRGKEEVSNNFDREILLWDKFTKIIVNGVNKKS